MAAAIRKFVVPAILGQLIVLMLAAQVLAIGTGIYGIGSVSPVTNYTPAYTYDSLFTDDGVLIPAGQR